MASEICLEWEEFMKLRPRKSNLYVYEAKQIEMFAKDRVSRSDYESVQDIEAASAFDYEKCILACQSWMQERMIILKAEEDEEDDEDDEDDKRGPLTIFERVVHAFTQKIESWTGSQGMTDTERAGLKRNFYEFCARKHAVQHAAQDAMHERQLSHRTYQQRGEFLYRLLHSPETIRHPRGQPLSVKLSFYDYMKFCILSRAIQREALQHLASFNLPDNMNSVIDIGLKVHSQVDQYYNTCIQKDVLQTCIPLFLGGRGTVFTDRLLGTSAFREASHVRISEVQSTPQSTGSDLGDYLESLILKIPFTRMLLDMAKDIHLDIVAVYGEFSTLESVGDPLFLKSILSHELPLWIHTLQTMKGSHVEIECDQYTPTSEAFWSEACRDVRHVYTMSRKLSPEVDEDELDDMESALDSIPIQMEQNTIEASTDRQNLMSENFVVYAERLNVESILKACNEGASSSSSLQRREHDDAAMHATGWRFMVMSRALFMPNGHVIERVSS